jgi:hypothetical protein
LTGRAASEEWVGEDQVDVTLPLYNQRYERMAQEVALGYPNSSAYMVAFQQDPDEVSVTQASERFRAAVRDHPHIERRISFLQESMFREKSAMPPRILVAADRVIEGIQEEIEIMRRVTGSRRDSRGILSGLAKLGEHVGVWKPGVTGEEGASKLLEGKSPEERVALVEGILRNLARDGVELIPTKEVLEVGS